MKVDRLTEMPTDASSSACKTEENKAIVDRWLTSFWGNDCNPAIVDELAAPDIFFSHSLHMPRIGPVSLKTFMANLREAFPDLSLERTAEPVVDVTWSCSVGCAKAPTLGRPFMISSWAFFPMPRTAR